MKKIIFIVFCLVTNTLSIFCNNFIYDKSTTTIPLTDTTKLGVLNSRMGSRFSLNYFAEKRGICTGALGFDADEYAELMIGIELNGKTEIFRLSNPVIGSEYLRNQTLQMALTGMVLEGQSSSGLRIKAAVISPFTPAKTLDDTTAIKLQIAPFYYLEITIENTSKNAVRGNVLVGLNKNPYNPVSEYAVWGYGLGRVANEIYYRDNSAPGALLSIESIDAASKAFVKGAFTGLKSEFSLQGNEKKEINYSYSTYYIGKVQFDKKKNQPLRYYYTKFWKNIDEVKKYARENILKNKQASASFENLLINSKLTPQEKWMMAITFHADLANSFLLLDEEKTPCFYLLEGRFKHQSTIDVAHETELAAIFNPWRLQLQLQQWSTYLATERYHIDPSRGRKEFFQGYSAAEYGAYLQHDVGSFPYINKTSEYDFGPYMAAEENTNYILLLYWYWKISGDEAFVRQKTGLIELLLHSLVNRDIDGNGIVDHAMGWTSFDSSKSLRIYTENTYIAMKQLVAYEFAAEMFQSLTVKGDFEIGQLVSLNDGDGQGHKGQLDVPNVKLRNRQSVFYQGEASKILRTLQKADREWGYIPISLDKKYGDGNQMSVCLGDALLYPTFCNVQQHTIVQAAALIKKTYNKAFPLSVKSYGITLTTGETPTWYSKIMVSDIVANCWFGSKNNTVNYVFEHNINSPFTYNDGQINEKEEWIGYFYPRGVVMLGYFLNEAGFNTTKTEEFVNKLK